MVVSESVSIEAINTALSAVPLPLRKELIEHFEEIQKAASLKDWEKVGLRAGKFVESSYCILLGFCTGSFPAKVSKPRNMQQACQDLERQTQTNAARSARIQIPRVIAAVYELRNNRAIGHAGGDVRPNQMDGLFFDQSSKWIMCELIRLFGGLPQSEAADLISRVSVRWTPAIWEDGDRKRVVIDDASIDDKVLVLLHFSDGEATLKELSRWVESSNITNFRKRCISRLHKANFIDFDLRSGVARLLPKDAKRVEDEILPLTEQTI